MSLLKQFFSRLIPLIARERVLLFSATLILLGLNPALAADSGCTTRDCHGGIMDIVPGQLPMMRLIQQNGLRHGDPDGCVICHGGTPTTQNKKKAHDSVPRSLARAPGPKEFYPDPGSVWIVDNTCGVCHAGYGYRTRNALMNTGAGKIQGNLHAWGMDEVKDYKVPWGNYAVEDRDGPVPSGSFPAYETYMEGLMTAFPAQFPARLELLPTPGVAQIEKDPKLAGITVQRQECQRCHIGVQGRQVRGDFRGMGCSACHMAYGSDGLYQGKDRTIPRDQAGHILRHRISGNQKTNGIPVETCNTCHNRGKRTGVSYTGLMESAPGPFDAKGNPQPQRHGKTYLPVSEDLHHRIQSRQGNPGGGLLCQDCHTSMDVHGDGNIHGTTLAQVEIECTDCHGTPALYPWELPIGHGDEFGRKTDLNKPRGLAETRLLSDQQFGYDHAKQDGFLLSARGNPLGNVVRQKNMVLVHSAQGTTFEVPVLKNLHARSQWKTVDAKIAMIIVTGHMDRMECYACHSSWAPQCYGTLVKVDFSKEPRGIPIPGTITEQNGYLRWEDPVLGINGEGRISPLMPGTQLAYTVVARDGRVLVNNGIPENPGEAKAIGQIHIPLSIDMAPAQPHTTQARARSCENCHTLPKTLGLGIGNGLFKTSVQQDKIMDMGEAGQGNVQIPGIPVLSFDWSQIVTRNGKQLATVGTHWPLSRAFNRAELDKISRAGLCMGCHGLMGTPDIWKRVSSSSTAGPLDTRAHTLLMEKMLKQYQP